MIKIIAIFQIATVWFAFATWIEQRDNSRRLINILRNQERALATNAPDAAKREGL